MRIGEWTVKKEISLGDLVAIVLAFASGLAAYYSHDTRITVLERDSTEFRSWKIEMREDLRDIKQAIVQIRDRLPPVSR